MEGLREGRKERERDAEGAEAEQETAGREREVEGTGGRNLSRKINVVGSFFIFFIEMGYSLRWIFFCFTIPI